MSGSRRSHLIPRRVWTDDELRADRHEAIGRFRVQRMQEPLEEYLDHFNDAKDILNTLLAKTDDLALLAEHAIDVIAQKDSIDGFRYLAGPPISIDDLKTLADTNSLARKTLEQDPDLVQRLVDTIRVGLDRRRFPWVSEQRLPTDSERAAAVLATAALMATRRTETGRRTEGKQGQEASVHAALRAQGFVEVTIPTGVIRLLNEGPQPGEFTREVVLGDRKADVVVGLWDRRVMPIECKVSNSSVNSVKRLNNDAAVKAAAWLDDFGDLPIVPVATLSGVYNLRNLQQAQQRGLTLYWAHRLSDLTDWIEATREH